MAYSPSRFQGVDINPDNVAYCQERNLRAEVGDALNLEHNDESFDGVVSSHLMQVFLPNQAADFMRELGRLVRPGGVVVISTLNWFPTFFRHPENVRAYPPQALSVYFAPQRGAQSPMYPNMPLLKQEAIWLRRPPLIPLRSARRTTNRVCGVLNRIQYRLLLRKWWTYDAFVIAFRKPA